MMYRKSFLLIITSIAMLALVLTFESACYQVLKAIVECRAGEYSQ